MKEKDKTPQEEIASMEERIDAIGQELMANSLSFIERRKQGKKIAKEEFDAHHQMQTDLKDLETTYLMLKRMGRVSGKSAKSTKEFDDGVMQKVKEKQTTLGSIVRNYNS